MQASFVRCEPSMKPVCLHMLCAGMILLSGTFARADCAPPLTGAPCGFGGAAILGPAGPSLNLGAGNPVNLATGNKYQADIDLPAFASRPGLEFVRYYNSRNPSPGVLGKGWTSSWDTRLHHTPQGWQIVQADGSRVHVQAGSPTAASQGWPGRLASAGDYHDWFWPNGTMLRFDAHGRLKALRHPRGDSITIQRHDDGPLRHHIRSVHDDHGLALHFHYQVRDGHAWLKALDTPMGRFTYTQDDQGRLAGMQRPDGMGRRYDYDAGAQSGQNHALTGITLHDASHTRSTRLADWTYDTLGRVARAARPGTGGAHHTLDFHYIAAPHRDGPATTRVVDEHSRQTTMRFARQGSRHVLLDVTGAGCSGCPPPGTHARYDANGRLERINGTRIRRDAAGAVRQLVPGASGWPGLTLDYDQQGRLRHWRSTATGTETLVYTAKGLLTERQFANGDRMAVTYDIQDRPITVLETHGDLRSTTRLTWHGNRLTRIDHPVETESRHYDDAGRVIARRIHRESPADGDAIQFDEGFSWDANHRLVRHDLPEGGSLHYQWGHGAQLVGVGWQDAAGTRHPVIQTVPGMPGYRHGNGVQVVTATDTRHRARKLVAVAGDAVLLEQTLDWDARHRISSENVHHAQASRPAVGHYAYDAQDRLVAVQPSAQAAQMWLAWAADGRLRAVGGNDPNSDPNSNLNSDSQPPHAAPLAVNDAATDASGLPYRLGDWELEYSAGRRLAHARHADGRHVRYQHNAFGYRIKRMDSQGRSSHFLFLNNQHVAQADGQGRVIRRYVFAHQVPVAFIDYTPDAPAGRLYAIHADLQGAPRLVTDAARGVRWRAHYTPLGQAVHLRGDLQLDLRLPGQVHDDVTGWHDNLLRTYLPAHGHYLEPDPLGPLPGTQAYGYARQQPRRYADPLGLLLFAFDGTRQSPATGSNVWKLSQYYSDGPVHYQAGPGRSDALEWDALTAHQARLIVDAQWQQLLRELQQADGRETVPIDILGFSRGAALARHFGNLVQQHVQQGLFRADDPVLGSISACVDLRFMGLFDSVAQFGIGGSQNYLYDLGIATAWDWVAHAVALHERRWLFPLLIANDKGHDNVVEAPFIGAHSDIGGGILPDRSGQAADQGDLSDVALNWMLWQARAALVGFAAPDSADVQVSSPILHDARPPVLRQVQDGDRSIQSSDGRAWLTYQDDHARLGRSAREQTEALIRRALDWRKQPGDEVGVVDLDGYARWLSEVNGWHPDPGLI